MMKKEKKRKKIFYGWYILGIGILGAFLSAGTSQLFMSIMLKPLTAEFGWSRTAATGAITAGTILGGLFSLPFGKIADRYGPRLLTSVGAIVMAVTFFLLTKLFALWQFYVVYVIARVVSMNAVSNVVSRTAVVNWFRIWRGRALGLLSMATPLGGSLLVIVAQFIMESHGWRSVFMTFAVAMIFLQVIPAALILRRRPEDLGLAPDGGESVAGNLPAQASGEDESSWTLNEAMHSQSIWWLISATIVSTTVGAGVSFHMVAYFTDVGIAPAAAVAVLSVYAFIGAVANVIWGFLSERISERLLATVVMVMSSAAVIYLQTVSTPTGAMIFAVIFGITARGEVSLVNIILAQYYGRGSFGAISGFVNPFSMLGLGIGPIIASVAFDVYGSYHAVFIVFAALYMVSAVLYWLAKKPGFPIRNSCVPVLH